MKKNIKPIEEAKRVLKNEISAINNVIKNLDSSFGKAVKTLQKIEGKVVISGVGKSGLIGRKIAATLSSTGTPAIFLHPVDSLHGDIGTLTSKDAVIMISRSGDTKELLELMLTFRHFDVPVISITASKKSKLGQASHITLETGEIQEACPFNLAPTSSTTATLALGDALSIALLKVKNFKKEDFAVLHQSGTLGKRLLLKISDIMWTGKHIPNIKERTSLKKAILTITSKKLGMVAITNKKNILTGIMTDGDLRRILQNEKYSLDSPIENFMTKKPKTINPDMLVADALKIMENFEITSLVCVDKQKKILGVVHIHDLLRAGVV